MRKKDANSKAINNIKVRHLYNLGYHSYEESEYYQLYHSKKFSENDFEKLVSKATANVIKKHMPKNDEHMSFQDIAFSVVSELVRKFGFKEVNFTATFNVFGWPDILDENDWKGDRSEQLNRLTEALKKEEFIRELSKQRESSKIKYSDEENP
jgi:hypothetical protein